MKAILIAGLILTSACSANVQSTDNEITTCSANDFCTTHEDPTDSCGKIVDSEPAPYGWACCQDSTTAQLFFHDGTSTTNVCTGGLTCQSGVCTKAVQ